MKEIAEANYQAHKEQVDDAFANYMSSWEAGDDYFRSGAYYGYVVARLAINDPSIEYSPMCFRC